MCPVKPVSVFDTIHLTGPHLSLPYYTLVFCHLKNAVGIAHAYQVVAVFKQVYITAIARQRAIHRVKITVQPPYHFTAVSRLLRYDQYTGKTIAPRVIVAVKHCNIAVRQNVGIVLQINGYLVQCTARWHFYTPAVNHLPAALLNLYNAAQISETHIHKFIFSIGAEGIDVRLGNEVKKPVPFKRFKRILIQVITASPTPQYFALFVVFNHRSKFHTRIFAPIKKAALGVFLTHFNRIGIGWQPAPKFIAQNHIMPVI